MFEQGLMAMLSVATDPYLLFLIFVTIKNHSIEGLKICLRQLIEY